MIKRNLLIGFGVGLVFSAGFLSVFPMASPSMELTKDQLEAYAKAQNFVLMPKDQFEELKKGKETGKQAPTNPKAPVKPSQPTAPSQMTPPASVSQQGQVVPPTQIAAPSTAAALPPNGTAPSANMSAPQVTPPKATEVPTTPVENVTVRIPYKATGIDTARLLVEAGLLPKDNNFVAALKGQNKLNRIRVGSYQIPKGTSADKIIQIITTPPAQ
ncbi:hypothetical protein ACQCN2_13780 [Brevibacillus ginsengisoli]|uniref:hypothetical protein n=1 Tax=Brevibacillus ginsengisoli TaxID=363854 RepID=UPI003CEC9D17